MFSSYFRLSFRPIVHFPPSVGNWHCLHPPPPPWGVETYFPLVLLPLLLGVPSLYQLYSRRTGMTKARIHILHICLGRLYDIAVS
jgi:hypothetical protein